MALEEIIFLKNVCVIEVEINVKIPKHVDFIIVCIEFTKVGVYNF